MKINRHLYQVLSRNLHKGKVLLVYGARRVGKTYLLKKLAEEEQGIYYNCELLQVQELLADTNSTNLENMIRGTRLLLLDEAQSVPDIGLKIKILYDTFPEVQIVASGSSSFDLIDVMSEPLTGRSRQYFLFPLSYQEISDATSAADAYGEIDNLLRFGSYPEVYLGNETEKKEELLNIASNYLYKDILTLGQLKRPDVIYEILKLLAFQIGHEVSLNEISNKTGISVHTVRKYCDMLEKAFILFSLPSFSRNLRNEISKSKKYYFIDLGIRNALINNFNPLGLRNDTGQLWENFCVMERIKKNHYARRLVNTYFWRTYEQKEIDYIEDIDGKLYAFEFTWDDGKKKVPQTFLEAYPGSEYKKVTKRNLLEFL